MYTKLLKKAANLLEDATLRQKSLGVHGFSDGFFLSALSDYATISKNQELLDFIKNSLTAHKKSKKLLKTAMSLNCAAAAKKADQGQDFLDLVAKGEQLLAGFLSTSPKIYERSFSDRINGLLPNYLHIEELISLTDFLNADHNAPEYENKKRALYSKVVSYDNILFNENSGLYYPIYNVKRRECQPKGELPVYPTAYALLIYTKLRPLFLPDTQEAKFIENKITNLVVTLHKRIGKDGYVTFTDNAKKNDSLSTTLFVYGAMEAADLLSNDTVAEAEKTFETVVEDLQLKNQLLSLPYTIPVNLGFGFFPTVLGGMTRTKNDVHTALGAFALATCAYYRKYGEKIDSEFDD